MKDRREEEEEEAHKERIRRGESAIAQGRLRKTIRKDCASLYKDCASLYKECSSLYKDRVCCLDKL